MANTIFPLLRPVADFWNFLTHDQNLIKLEEFKGGVGTQNSWHAKFLRAEQEKKNNQYLALQKRFHEGTSFFDLVSDNSLRLTILSGFERLFTIRQAFSSLKYRFYLPDNSVTTLGELFNAGFFTKGFFRGAALNFLQWTGVTYNSLLWATGAPFLKQLFVSSTFETFFYPLDTVKTLLYADVGGEYKGFMDCLGRTIQENGIGHLYRGIAFKLLYNSVFLVHLKNWYEQSSWTPFTTAAWILSYGLLNIKTRLQISDTPLSLLKADDLLKISNTSLFRGVGPFVLLNLLLSYQIYGFYSPDAQRRVIESVTDITELTSPVKYNKFERNF